MSQTLKERILKTLINSLQLKKEDIDEALRLQKKRGVSLDKILLERGLIKEKDLLVLLVRELNIPFINVAKYKIDPSLKEVIPARVARQYGILPLFSTRDRLTIVLSDPLNIFAIDDLKSLTNKEMDIVLGTKEDIQKAIDHYYGQEKTATVMDVSKGIAADDLEIVNAQEEGEDVESAVGESKKPPIIRMVNLVIQEAIGQRASDIHVEPTAEGLRVRFRVDGVLQDILEIPKENQNAVTVRIKILSRLDITMNHIPQDGRFKLKIREHEIDFRVSLLPTAFGQKIVMRILDKAKLAGGLKSLGMGEHSINLLQEAIAKPFGMILLTGPTGSGKSTTLYSLINELNTVERNITTVEDPVEYLIEGLTQIQTHTEIGLTFAEGLRAILRQSPDVVMIGEIRDNETADIAIKASLTGQLVLSTLHTNDAPGALTRLVDMGVEPFLVASSLILVAAQRLCRKICPQCKQPLEVPKNILSGLNFKFKPGTIFYQGKGCEACRQTGYLGRLAITEILEIDDEVRNMLMLNKSSDDIKEYARQKKGMVTLWEDALEKCEAGVTTLEEVMRVTAGDEN